MIDLHLHILADVDDGPSNRADSESMMRLAASLGFTHLVATPHLQHTLVAEYAARVRDEIHWLTPVAEQAGISLSAGYEIRLNPDLGARLSAGEPISLAGTRTVLVELQFAYWPEFTERAIDDVVAAGYRPLLAHPERYLAAVDDPRLLYRLRQSGVLLQITTGSLAGLFGARSQDLAERLLVDGLADVIASDAHSPGRRYVAVTEGLARANELVGQERVRQLTVDNPSALLADQPLPPQLAPSAGSGLKNVTARV
jgi:protein-tyrosine phosphatase